MPGRAFARQLARENRRTDINNMLAEMSASEFDEWYRYYASNPLSHLEDRQLMAQLIAATYNASGRYKKTFEVKDFLPDCSRSAQKTCAQQLSVWRVMAGGGD